MGRLPFLALAAAVDHLGVVRVLGVEHDGDGYPFVVRERVKGVARRCPLVDSNW